MDRTGWEHRAAICWISANVPLFTRIRLLRERANKPMIHIVPLSPINYVLHPDQECSHG
jgi:hypothetical protein